MTMTNLPDAPMPEGYVTLANFLDYGGDLNEMQDVVDILYILTYGVMAKGRENCGQSAITIIEDLAAFDAPIFPVGHPSIGRDSESDRARTYFELYRNAMWTLEALSSDEMVERARAAYPPAVLAEAMAQAEADLDGDLRPFAFRVENVGDYVCAMSGVPCSGVGIVLEPRGYVGSEMAKVGGPFVFSPEALMTELAGQLAPFGLGGA